MPVEKGMNPSVLSDSGLGSLALIRQPVKEKENSEFKSALIHLRNWPCYIPLINTYIRILWTCFCSKRGEKCQRHLTSKTFFFFFFFCSRVREYKHSYCFDLDHENSFVGFFFFWFFFLNTYCCLIKYT